jgi:N-methylhydantoinase A/oxoprolinase/acetone carboxylase beta subunit
MPDLLSIGLGGGSLVTKSPLQVGPLSVGYKLTEKALVFGGDNLTCTDIAVAAGLADIGDSSLVAHLDGGLVEAAMTRIHEMLYHSIDRMKTDASETPLLAVGGGAMLAPDRMAGISEVIKVSNHDVANAVGAAIARISGEADRIFHDMSREEVLAAATEIATQNALDSGARSGTIEVIEMEDLPLAYLPGNAVRARVRVVGDVGVI